MNGRGWKGLRSGLEIENPLGRTEKRKSPFALYFIRPHPYDEKGHTCLSKRT